MITPPASQRAHGMAGGGGSHKAPFLSGEQQLMLMISERHCFFLGKSSLIDYRTTVIIPEHIYIETNTYLLSHLSRLYLYIHKDV